MEARVTGGLTPRTLGRRPVLDGLRGVAVTLVVLMHTGILPGGFVGVDLFFALSGFLITTLLYEEWDRSGTIGFRRFYERRARRLLPALVLVVLLAALTDALVYPLTGWALPEKALTTFLFVNNWVAALGHSQALGGLNPTWSLGQEEQFYLLWPVLLACMLRRHLGPRAVAAILMVTIVALIYVSADVTSQATPSAVYYSPADRAAELLLGCLAAVVWRNRLIPSPVALLGRLTDMSGRVAGRLARPARLLLCLVLIYLLWHLIAHVTPDTRRLRMRTDYMDSCLIGVLLIINLLALPTSLIARAIGCLPLRQLGRISYALYLLHLPIYNLLRHWYPAASVDQIAVATFALAVPAAALSWRLIESRLLLNQPAQQRRAGVRTTWTRVLVGARPPGPSHKRSPASGVAR
jgi:peptidoglycan/LPS O-acetylase OafA/YrhL